MRLAKAVVFVFSSLLVGAPLGLTPVASASPSLGNTCTDWMKLAYDAAARQEVVCGPISSPAEVLYWIPAQPMPGGIHDAGTPCPGVPPYTFARSTDNYQIWCTEGQHVYLPGDVTITDPPEPIWGLYSP